MKNGRLFGGMVLATCVAGSVCWAQEPTHAELQQQLDALRHRVSELQSSQTAVSESQIATAVDRVFRDAETRSRLFAAEGFTAGWDKGFIIKSADGRYLMKLGTLFQVRHVTDYRDNAKPNGDSDTQSGWEIKRAQIIVNGNACSPDLNYWFMAEAGSNGSLGLLDAWVSYKFADAWAFKVGQFFDPVSRELLNGPPRRLAVEPSLLDFYLGGGLEDRIQGVSLLYGLYQNDNPLNVEITTHDGVKSRNTTWEDDQGSGNYGFAARIESKCFGDWANHKDHTAAGNKQDLLVFGIAGDFTDFDNQQQWLGTIDAQWEPGELAFYAAFNGRYREPRNTGNNDEIFDWGGIAQAAWLFTDRWEVFGRYSYIDFDNPAPNTDDVYELCAGVNWYLVPEAPHRAKMTIDITYLPHGGGPGAKGFGIAGGTEDTEIVVRGQFQLLL